MPDHSVSARAIRRIRLRLIPFVGLMYLVAYLDRLNVGFAALQMNQALGFSSQVFGTGASAGIAFINSVGNLGGFAGPYLMGWMRDAFGDFHIGLRVLSAAAVIGGILVLRFGSAREARGHHAAVTPASS